MHTPRGTHSIPLLPWLSYSSLTIHSDSKMEGSSVLKMHIFIRTFPHILVTTHLWDWLIVTEVPGVLFLVASGIFLEVMKMSSWRWSIWFMDDLLWENSFCLHVFGLQKEPFINPNIYGSWPIISHEVEARLLRVIWGIPIPELPSWISSLFFCVEETVSPWVSLISFLLVSLTSRCLKWNFVSNPHYVVKHPSSLCFSV